MNIYENSVAQILKLDFDNCYDFFWSVNGMIDTRLTELGISNDEMKNEITESIVREITDDTRSTIACELSNFSYDFRREINSEIESLVQYQVAQDLKSSYFKELVEDAVDISVTEKLHDVLKDLLRSEFGKQLIKEVQDV